MPRHTVTTNCEIRIVRCTDGSIDLEMCEFDAQGRISTHVPWQECWFNRFLGGERGELAPWLKQQVINAFVAGFENSYIAGWMAESTPMVPREPPCSTLVLCAPRE